MKTETTGSNPSPAPEPTPDPAPKIEVAGRQQCELYQNMVNEKSVNTNTRDEKDLYKDMFKFLKRVEGVYKYDETKNAYRPYHSPEGGYHHVCIGHKFNKEEHEKWKNSFFTE